MQTANPRLSDEDREALARQDWRWLLDDQRGRRFVRDLLRWSGCDAAGTLGDNVVMAFQEGKREIGLTIKSTIRAVYPEGLLKLEAEFTEELAQTAELTRKERERERQEAPPELEPA